MNNLKKILIVLVLAILIGAFFSFDVGQYLSLEYLKGKQTNFSSFYKENPLLAMGAFTAVYIVSTALS
ncbi:MAG: TVP38/TMEM64 family protein, partial [Nitrospinaceae bacterium]